MSNKVTTGKTTQTHTMQKYRFCIIELYTGILCNFTNRCHSNNLNKNIESLFDSDLIPKFKCLSLFFFFTFLRAIYLLVSGVNNMVIRQLHTSQSGSQILCSFFFLLFLNEIKAEIKMKKFSSIMIKKEKRGIHFFFSVTFLELKKNWVFEISFETIKWFQEKLGYALSSDMARRLLKEFCVMEQCLN